MERKEGRKKERKKPIKQKHSMYVYAHIHAYSYSYWERRKKERTFIIHFNQRTFHTCRYSFHFINRETKKREKP